MANFRTRVDDLTAFSTTDDVALADWLAEGCKAIIDVMPDKTSVTGETGDFTPTGGTNVSVPVMGVTRKTTASNGTTYQCRRISYRVKHDAQDENHVLYATETDPVYYIEPQSGTSANKIKVLPLSSANLCNATIVQYPTPAVTDSSITLFPDEYEYLVVLYASIKAVEQLLATEEDVELYVPMLQNLKQDYATGLSELKPPPPQPQGRR